MAIDNVTKLLPCPFCGNPNVLFRDTEYDRTLWIIECNQCHMEVAAKHKDLIHGRKSTHDDLVIGWNRRAEIIPPQSDGEVECVMCGETFTETDLTELQEMGEAYHREEGCFLCPDCWDSFRRMDPEEQVKMAVMNGWKEVNHGTKHTD